MPRTECCVTEDVELRRSPSGFSPSGDPESLSKLEERQYQKEDDNDDPEEPAASGKVAAGTDKHSQLEQFSVALWRNSGSRRVHALFH